MEDLLCRLRIPRVVEVLILSHDEIRGPAGELFVFLLQILQIAKDSSILARLLDELVKHLIHVPKEILEIVGHQAIIQIP